MAPATPAAPVGISPPAAASPPPSDDRLAARMVRRRLYGRPEGLLLLTEAVLARERPAASTKAVAARHAAHALVALGRVDEARQLLAERVAGAGGGTDPVLDSPRVSKLID